MTQEFKKSSFAPIPGILPSYQFSSLSPYANVLAHAVFTRAGGVSEAPFDSLNVRYGIGDLDVSVTRNREIMQRFFEEQFLGGRRTVMMSANQSHSDHVFVFRESDRIGDSAGSPGRKSHVSGNQFPYTDAVDDVDAFVTDRRDVTLLMQTADCQSVLLVDPHARVLGLVHNGWRGSLQNIVGKTVAAMCREFGADPAHIVCAIGPSIGPCCHEFSDPRAELPREFHPYILEDGRRVDFLAATRDQLVACGVSPSAIEFSDVCTCDHTDEFYSFRKERLTGRFGMMAGLKL